MWHKTVVQRDWRDDRIEQLERENCELRARVTTLEALVAKLIEQVNRNSRNSSKPPSSDGPAKPKRPKNKSSGRKPGGQPGHDKHERQLVPVDQVDSLTVVKPEHCECCSAVLTEYDLCPTRHQYCELPVTRPLVHEVHQHSGYCARCGIWTLAKLPDGVPTRAFGPSVDSTVGVLMGVYRLSKRSVAAVMAELFGLQMSVGAVVGCQKAVSDALAQPVLEAHEFAQQQSVKNADETSWRQGNKRAWLWTVVTTGVTMFMIQSSRSAEAARAILGGISGILCTDRYSGYGWWPTRQRQVCWSHLIRDFTAISERAGQSKQIGNALLAEAERMFAWWNRVKDGTLKPSTFQVYMRSLQCRVEQLLGQGSLADHSKTAGTCKKILEVFPSLWTFVHVQGVEPTNNAAERAVRHAVVYRKISYGTHSEWGSRFVERILTVHATCKQQGTSALAFVRHACEAALTRSPPPSLIPADQPSQLRSSNQPAALAA